MKTTLECNGKTLLGKHHNNCIFKSILKESDLSSSFDSKGNLKGKFYCHEKYQGYDNRVHGGIIASIIDESMVHCLMGHDLVGVTIDLNIQYRLPLYIKQYVKIITTIDEKLLDGIVYKMKSILLQNRNIAISANAKFFTEFR